MGEKIKVVGSIVSKTGVTLYTIDGKTVELSADKFRTHKLIAEITPIIARHKVAEVDIDTFDATKMIEEKSGGLIRFFRVAKSKIKSIFGASAERSIGEEHSHGMISQPVKQEAEIQTGVEPVTPEQMKQLEQETTFDDDATLVAVVGDTPIIGAEALESQIEAAAEQEHPVGFLKFMERLAVVAKERKHTAQELLDFMKLADLPIADDGCIIGYKALAVRSEGKDDRHFVDHHSGNVKQKVGSRVEMANLNLVDDNRRVLCSNGLHIARRKYLSGYGSNGIVCLAKIAPEDVISVPKGEPDKMRCAAYLLVAELPKSAHDFIRSNKPMTQNEEASKILGNVIKGNHAQHVETVTIGSAYGGNLKITKVGEADAAPPAEVKLDEAVTAKVLDDKEKAGALDVGAINKQVDTIIETEKAAKVEEPKAETSKKIPLANQNAKKPSKSKPAPAPVADPKLSSEQQRALTLVLGGMSKREAERATGVSARTIGRLLEKKKAA